MTPKLENNLQPNHWLSLIKSVLDHDQMSKDVDHQSFMPDEIIETLESSLQVFYEYNDPHDDYCVKTLTARIKKSFYSFLDAGVCAHHVKLTKSYKILGYRTFTDYCHQEIRKSIWQVNHLIRGAFVTLQLLDQGFTIVPTCEAQARPLTKFFGDELCEKWGEVLDSVNHDPCKITAAKIKKVLYADSPLPMVTPEQPARIVRSKNGVTTEVEISDDVVEKIEAIAMAEGISSSQLLDELLDSRIKAIAKQEVIEDKEDVKILTKNPELLNDEGFLNSLQLNTILEKNNFPRININYSPSTIVIYLSGLFRSIQYLLREHSDLIFN
jgi:hypothetical protein